MLNLSDRRLHVAALSERLHLYQLAADSAIPPELQLPAGKSGLFYSVTYAAGEVSIVTPVLAVSDAVAELKRAEKLKYEGPWTCLKINGPMDLTMTGDAPSDTTHGDEPLTLRAGVMAHFTAPLARRSVAIFAISTYNTDFVLVHDADRQSAIGALREAGWVVDDLA